MVDLISYYGHQSTGLLNVEYLKKYGASAENVLIHHERMFNHEWPEQQFCDRKAAFGNILEQILDLYRNKKSCKYVGFTAPTLIPPLSYPSITRSLHADTLPESFVVPPMAQPSGWPFKDEWFCDQMVETGAVLGIRQENGELANKVTRLYVRPFAPLDEVASATARSSRVIEEAIIFGRRNPGFGARRWTSLQRDMGLVDMSSLRKMQFWNCDMGMLSNTKLPASLESLTFIDNEDDMATASIYNEEHVLKQLHDAQKNDPDNGGLKELIHVQRRERRPRFYSTVSREKLVDIIETQRQLTTLCIHQDTPLCPLKDFALSTLKLVSIRGSNDDVDDSELKKFAEIATEVEAWGGSWNPIVLVDHACAPDFEERAKSFAVGIFSLRQLTTYLTEPFRHLSSP